MSLLSIGDGLGSRWRRVLTMECRCLIASTCISRAHFLAWSAPSEYQIVHHGRKSVEAKEGVEGGPSGV